MERERKAQLEINANLQKEKLNVDLQREQALAEQQREIDRLNFEKEKKELENRLSSKFTGHSVAVGPSSYAPGFGSLETVRVSPTAI